MPGKTANDDVRIVDSDSSVLTFSEFKKMLGKAYGFLNFNYPDELIKEQVYDANILSFYKSNNKLFISRTALVGTDSIKRHLPLTKILISEDEEKDNIISSLNEGWDEINFPKYNYNRGNDYVLRNPVKKHYSDIKKLVKEVKMANANIIENFFSNYKSGKSIIFNPIEISKYKVCYYLDIKVHKNTILLSVLLIIAALIVLFLRSSC